MGRLDRVTQDDPRCRFNHENRRGPVGPPPLKFRRSGDPGAISPNTPKPRIVPKGQAVRTPTIRVSDLFAKPTCRVDGRCWPEHLHTDAPFLPAQLTLMGPPNALGAWRWYEAPVSTGHIRIKVDSFLRHVEYRLSG